VRRNALLLASVLLVACAMPRAQYEGADIVPRGYMECVRPHHFVAFVNLDVLETPLSPAVIAHEWDHVQRARALFPTCRAYVKWLNVPSNRLAFEALAFCTSVVTAVEHKLMPRDSAYRAFARMLTHPSYHWPDRLSVPEAESLIRVACQERDR
jgi:hypothetical protein